MSGSTKRVGWLVGGGIAAAAILEIAYATTAWFRYGHPGKSAKPDALLDRFMPECEVAESHEIEVDAPAEVTYAAACLLDLNRSWIVRAIFKGRELLMRSPSPTMSPKAIRMRELTDLGWGVLVEEPDRELVMGAITQPWRSDVKFESLPPDEFPTFAAPGYAKIAWTLAAAPLGESRSVFRTQTRVATTDVESRRRFRRYWTLVSPGILLIRRSMLPLVKADAARRSRANRRRSWRSQPDERLGDAEWRIVIVEQEQVRLDACAPLQDANTKVIECRRILSYEQDGKPRDDGGERPGDPERPDGYQLWNSQDEPERDG